MLRKKHQSHDHKALMEMLPFRKVDPTVEPTTIQENLQPNLMIAVACVDTWYPALVKSESEPEALVEVSFAELGKSLGVFKWPSGKDIHKVARASVISTKVDIQPRAGGRLWEVTDAHKIDEKYKRLQ
ncbi:hypothetical protein RRG08_026149 [Elysia crispata]|uniref:Uncharacterized protein n=1 Tax=Elysia crispata TaxID=231223 RepID=A0AAE1DDR6_9GAST|nr:hypothetical protein RRG08_026149 [Elysia crispata]